MSEPRKVDSDGHLLVITAGLRPGLLSGTRSWWRLDSRPGTAFVDRHVSGATPLDLRGGSLTRPGGAPRTARHDLGSWREWGDHPDLSVARPSPLETP